MRLEFLARVRDDEPGDAVRRWTERHAGRIAQFKKLVDSARNAGAVSAPMLAQLAAQARNLLAR